MYYPDDVFQKAYAFIDSVHASQTPSAEANEKALGELIAAIRQDLISRRILSRIKLKPDELRGLTST
jgi:hypothetical protein